MIDPDASQAGIEKTETHTSHEEALKGEAARVSPLVQPLTVTSREAVEGLLALRQPGSCREVWSCPVARLSSHALLV